MSFVEWGLQALLVLALGACLPTALRLERTLSALGRDRADLASSANAFVDAVQEAEGAISRLRQASDGAGRGIAAQVAAAERVGDDLRFLLERAEAKADRLDAAVRALNAFARAQDGDATPREVELSSPPQPERPPAHAPVPMETTLNKDRARAEQAVLRALRGGAVAS